MTVITPTQRQLIFTTSFAEQFQPSRSYALKRTFAKVLKGRMTVGESVSLLLPVLCVGGVVALLLGATSSVVLSYQVNRMTGMIEQQERDGELLRVAQAEVLSPDALKTYAGMVQLSNPAHTQYVSQTADVLAAHETLVPLP